MESYKKIRPFLAGILNVTPDSFSDGGEYNSFEKALKQAKLLHAQGAEIIDIGADSTRPGSVCCGEKEEWRRLEGLVEMISEFCVVSVDTHSAVTANKSILKGARLINDISSGGDSDMFSVIADSDSKIILTYTRCNKVHEFSIPPSGDLIINIKNFFLERINKAFSKGVKTSQIILDPGMGAFLSDNKNDSWELLRRIDELSIFKFPFMLGISRKGFLKSDTENNASGRDLASAFSAAVVLQNCKINFKYLRVHNVELHNQMFDDLLCK